MEHKHPAKVLMLSSVASMIDQFNMPNICLLQRMGYEVHVACNFKQGNTCDAQRIQRLRNTLQQMGVYQHQWDCPRNISSVRDCYRAYRQLAALIRRCRFAWLHCHSPVGGALARMAAHHWDIGVIYTAHGFHFYKGAPVGNWMLYYPAEKLFSWWTDVLITVNQEDYCFAKQNLHVGKIYYIPGIGIDTEKYRLPCSKDKKSFCSKYNIPQDAKILLSVGELSVRKNHRLAVAALSALKRQDVYYLICGQGSERKALQEYADSLGIGRYLCMPGYQEDMPWIYQNADIFLFPSIQEGMPAALMEAMAAGLPCIVSDIRGNRELIGGQITACLGWIRETSSEYQAGGIRYAPESLNELVSALEIMLESKKLRKICGNYNRKKIKSYGIAQVQRRMKRIYGDMGRTMDQ